MFARWATLQYGLAMILTSWLPVVVVLLHSSLPLARPKQGLASGWFVSCNVFILELQTKVRKDFTITDKAPTRTFSWLKALTIIKTVIC